ncbi:MAG: ATP-binding protein, partial [Candidatus Zophobacter franzmannii]|nr:ATP-binding protein [Candidatus Zophobacter franzmannii]
MNYINLPPNPKSLIESMREIGYSIETAVADIIDNSITACASVINIRFDWNNSKPWLAIIDNDNGMSKQELVNAMKLGSENPLNTRDREDL